MTTDYNAQKAVRRDIAAQVARFTRIDSDVNGNPRYYIPGYVLPETHTTYIVGALGLTKYRGKQYGADGYVLQSYNIEADAIELQRLESLSKYDIQGLQFLHETSTSLTFQEAVPQRSPLWHKGGGGHGIHYSVTLKNKRGSYTFDFWDSIAAKINGERPTEYDILACLDTIDKNDTFADFCGMFGYDVDSMTAHRTFEAVRDQSENLRRIFTLRQLQKLADIN